MKNQTPARHASSSSASMGARPPVRTVYLIAQVHHALRMRMESALRPHNLTLVQYMILDLLANRHGLSSADLSRRFFVTPQTMGEMIASLERRDLIAREKDPANRRVLRVELAREGRQLLEDCTVEIEAIEAATVSEIEGKDLDSMRTILGALLARLRQDASQHGIENETIFLHPADV
jgi:DNA-binding MarR family transcriptional regulator